MDVWSPGPLAGISLNPPKATLLLQFTVVSQVVTGAQRRQGQSLLSSIMKNRRLSTRLRRGGCSQRVCLAGDSTLVDPGPIHPVLSPPGAGPLPLVLQNEWFLMMSILLPWPVSRWAWGRSDFTRPLTCSPLIFKGHSGVIWPPTPYSLTCWVCSLRCLPQLWLQGRCCLWLVLRPFGSSSLRWNIPFSSFSLATC